MSVAMERYFHGEKYWSNIKKMYQNSYSLHVAIKTGALRRSACSARLTDLSNNHLTVVTHSVIYRAFHILVPLKRRCWFGEHNGAGDRWRPLNAPSPDGTFKDPALTKQEERPNPMNIFVMWSCSNTGFGACSRMQRRLPVRGETLAQH